MPAHSVLLNKARPQGKLVNQSLTCWGVIEEGDRVKFILLRYGRPHTGILTNGGPSVLNKGEGGLVLLVRTRGSGPSPAQPLAAQLIASLFYPEIRTPC